MGTDTPIAIQPSTNLLTASQTPIAACPAVNRRPRDLEQWRTASVAADGDKIIETDACGVATDMTIWFPEPDEPEHGRWRAVKDRTTVGLKTTITFITAPGYASWWVVASDKPIVQRLIPRSRRDGA